MVKHLRILVLSFLLLGCGEKPPKDLEQAAAVVEFALNPFQLSNSMFFAAFPNGTPKQFVSFYFSPAGHAEWGASEDDDESFKEMTLSIGAPLRPRGVAYYHTLPNTKGGKQIVVRWDNLKGTIIIEGYVDPTQEPLLVREVQLPKIDSTGLASRMAAQINLEGGLKFQAF